MSSKGTYYQAVVYDGCHGSSRVVGNFRQHQDAVIALVIQEGVRVDNLEPRPDWQKPQSNCLSGRVIPLTEPEIIEDISDFNPELPQKWQSYLDWLSSEEQRLKVERDEWERLQPIFAELGRKKLTPRQQAVLSKTATDRRTLTQQVDILIETLEAEEVRALGYNKILIDWQRQRGMTSQHPNFELLKTLREQQKSKGKQ